MAFHELRFFTVNEALQKVLDNKFAESDGEQCALALLGFFNLYLS